MLISAMCLSIGQLLWKFANVSDFGAYLTGISGIWTLFVKLLPGFIVYGIGAVIMTIGLGYGELSVLQPINCMSYVFGLILSAVFLTDPITPLMVVGEVIIMAGVVLIGGSSGGEAK
ncbi:MAG: EamA/RhaT family transporter [Lachnospiraceae bacterium]|nr:EamA/RhaT family transporter [Lachnospiraceae bacterium]